MKKLNITFCSFPDYAGNAKALYEYMVKTYKNNMNYTWIVYNENTVKILSEKGIKAILIGTDEFKKYVPKTDVFFTTHANLVGDKIKAKNSIYVELWHGIGPKPVGFLAQNLSNEDDKWYHFLSRTIDYVICSSEFWRIIFSAMFKINPQRIKPLGLPLLDEIKYSNGKENLSKVLNKDISIYKKIIMYAPTFKKGCGRNLESNYNKENILNFDDYNDEQLIKYLKKNNYLLIVKRHPSDECIYNFIENEYIMNIDNDMLNKHSFNVNSILNAFDLLVTDYSSLGLEFSFLNKPVIYISKNLDEYKNNRGIILDNYNFWTENKCTTYKEFIKLLEKLLSQKENVFIKNKDLFYGDLSDGGCDKICNFFFEDNKLKKGIKRKDSKLLILEEENKKQKNIIEEQINTIEKLTESDIRLKEIENSRSWKFLEKIRKIKDVNKNE